MMKLQYNSIMRYRIGFTAAFVLASALVSGAQGKPKYLENPNDTRVVEAGGSLDATAPSLSADVQKDLEVLALKSQLTTALKQLSDLQAAVGGCQAQLGPLQLERNQAALDAEQKGIIEKYEKANPGFTLDHTTMKPVAKPKG